MNKTKENEFVNETLLSTPLPKACSTGTKLKQNVERNLQKISIEFNNHSRDITDDSLGLLSLSKASSNAIGIDIARDEPRHDRDSLYSSYKTPVIQETEKFEFDLAEQLELNRKRAYEIINNINESMVEKLIQQTEANRLFESTINESHFKTPKPLSSRIHDVSQKILDQSKSLGEIFEMNDKPQENESSLRDVFKFAANSTLIDQDSYNSDMFMPAGKAEDRFLADELSIQKEHGLPTDKRCSIFSQLEGECTTDKISMGEFFRARSDDTSIFHNLSPEKTAPTPLLLDSIQNLNLSTKPPQNEGSVLSITQINNLISSEDTGNALAKLLRTPKKEGSEISFSGREKNLRHLKQFASSNDLRNNYESGNKKKKLPTAKSMNCISTSTNKENELGLMDKSISSMRSTCSLDTLPDSKLPIECTRQELVWGCVKLGKNVTQEFFVRNKYHQRMRFQVSSNHPSYKISKGDSEPLTTVAIMLHPMESRQCRITFQPTTQGPHVGTLTFHPVIKGEVKKTHRQLLLMYGYGGYATLDLQNISKDATGKLWLSLGCLDSKMELTQGFVVKNNGTHPGFVCLSSTPKSLCSFESVNIQPSEIVLKPGEQARININYKPTKQDFRHLLGSFACGVEVVEIAQIRLISGCEIIRSRLRRIHRKLTNSDLQVDPSIQILHRAFQGEFLLEDLRQFKESVGAAKELLHQLTYKDISVTIEQDTDRTIMPGMEGFDETSMYHTLINNPNNTSYDITTNEAGLKVEPSQIILTPPFKTSDSILITSESTVEESYKIKVEPEGVITLNDMCGLISPGKIKILTLSCSKVQKKSKQNITVLVLTENNALEVSVKIIYNITS